MARSADPLACGDLIAWRRYAYGKAAAEDGDWTAAAEMFAQAIGRAADWPPAWFALFLVRPEWVRREGGVKAPRIRFRVRGEGP
jgi:predicted TPR repeat methyltransferase